MPMHEISATARARIEAQGFVGCDARTLTAINYWLRFTPAVCMVWTAIGTVLESPVVLGALVPFALLGGLLPGHPFDVVYNHGVRHLTGGPRLPRYRWPRRSACLLASVILAGAALSFQLGAPLVGHILGWFMVSAALVNVATGFCIPSFFYGLLFGKPASCDVPTEQH